MWVSGGIIYKHTVGGVLRVFIYTHTVVLFYGVIYIKIVFALQACWFVSFYHLSKINLPILKNEFLFFSFRNSLFFFLFFFFFFWTWSYICRFVLTLLRWHHYVCQETVQCGASRHACSNHVETDPPQIGRCHGAGRLASPDCDWLQRSSWFVPFFFKSHWLCRDVWLVAVETGHGLWIEPLPVGSESRWEDGGEKRSLSVILHVQNSTEKDYYSAFDSWFACEREWVWLLSLCLCRILVDTVTNWLCHWTRFDGVLYKRSPWEEAGRVGTGIQLHIHNTETVIYTK